MLFLAATHDNAGQQKEFEFCSTEDLRSEIDSVFEKDKDAAIMWGDTLNSIINQMHSNIFHKNSSSSL